MKKCFIIAPIGAEGSTIRKRSDLIFYEIIAPVVNKFEFEAIRADMISLPGNITTQIIEHLIMDNLVIADLTDHNPNVFYELAIRHASGKPIIQFIEFGQKLPFDLNQMRTIFYSCENEVNKAKFKTEIARQISSIINEPNSISSPILDALRLNLIKNAKERSILIPDNYGVDLGVYSHYGSRLNEIEKRILVAAKQNGNYVTRHPSGRSVYDIVVIGGYKMYNDDDESENAQTIDALNRLSQLGLLDQLGRNGYVLTGRGHQIAQKILETGFILPT